MTTGKRDYAQEYRRRIERALAQGRSRSAARGHPKAGENGARGPPPSVEDSRLQVALRTLRDGASLATAAREARVAPEKLRYVASRDGLIRKEGGRWGISPDVKRSIEIFTRGERKVITTASLVDASLAGRYRAAVKRFLNSNERTVLVPFEGKTVRDVAGVEHLLETNPNTLYRLAASTDHAAEHIYRVHL